MVPIVFTDVDCCSRTSQLYQLLELYLLLCNSLHAQLYHFGQFAPHPARLVILAQLAVLSFFIMLIFPYHPIFETMTILETAADCNQYLLPRHFAFPGPPYRDISKGHIILHLLNRCLCVFNLLPFPSGITRITIHNAFSYRCNA